MKIGTLICKVSKELYLRSYQNTKQQKEVLSSITQHQPWRRWYCNSTTNVDTHANRAQQYPATNSESVEVISREIITPSSPTSIHNKNVYFSLLDQLSPCVYNSIVLFYKNDTINNNNNNQSSNNTEKRTKLLKQSLSEVLVDFYPFAGRIIKNELIECNDEGVELCEANVSDKSLTNFIKNPSIADIEALLPFQGGKPRHANIVLSVQVNHFRCGGMALGVCLSHKITDGVALTEFVNTWSTKARNSNSIISPPNFNGESLFPPSIEYNDVYINVPVDHEEKIVMRKLIFDKKTIDRMKVEAESIIFRPTTNEVVTAFVWKHFPKLTFAMQFVNLRTKMVPPIPVNSIGNFITFTVASSLSPSSSCMIKELRKSIKKIDNDYIHDLLLNDKSLTNLKKQVYEVFQSHGNNLYFSNASKFPVYEADFGMGKPIWVCFPRTPVKNFVSVTSTPCGEGIEVWISGLEDDIAILDHSLSRLGYPIVKHVSLGY